MLKKIENPNSLPAEVKVLMVNGQALVDDTRKRVKGNYIDLTCRLQLRDDCGAVENVIKKLQKGKYREKDIEELRLAVVRLKTTSEKILG